ncbi:hypothetical protein GUITHDRAFT_115251 [Guillardia theta CCMP2712]|uniref:RWP-RK domain-containing protein n=1 Tax=Guillardia theta (strain CCMP2712) TaxID=905079 RepID=L1IRI1_GUITC|nr:hypothetical protein GUITHDRAFT_115251 [Guillardia theta CCMP2712]EKX38702.1 hypothetical protein GUITHDRAFT_115251 [Guillardia theta CCMP2712]|eukprot:XP_005825682.1 hypothetical protein GUITHDRAFT_115251 [Guillardia theta CCMP2712]
MNMRFRKKSKMMINLQTMKEKQSARPMGVAMNWQHPRIDPYGSYVDPYGHGGMDYMLGISQDDQHFLSSGTTREYEELARRKAEHMEAAEHIAPQHNHPMNAVRSSRLTEKVLREHFHLPLVDVARKFGMCTTAFKKLCRKQGVMQWPVDSRSTACSGNSSPRAHDVLSNLALDDSSSVGSNSSQPEERQPARSRNSTERSEEEAFNGSEARDHPSLIVKPSTESSARPEKFDFSFGGDFMQRNMPRGRGMMAFQDYHDPYGRMGPMGPYRPREGPMFGPGRGIPYPPTSAYAHPMPMAGCGTEILQEILGHPTKAYILSYEPSQKRRTSGLGNVNEHWLKPNTSENLVINWRRNFKLYKCRGATTIANAIDEISRDVNESPPEDGRCSQDHLDIGSACKEETERHRDGPSLSASDLDAGMHAPWTDIHPD